MYHSQLGRFVSRDPVGYGDGVSTYSAYFVPNRNDPSGLTIGPIYLYLRGLRCVIKTGPTYSVTGDVPRVVDLELRRQTFPFSMSATFSNNLAKGEACFCCQIRHDIKWNAEFGRLYGPPHSGFRGGEWLPNTWYEDRGWGGHRLGHRSNRPIRPPRGEDRYVNHFGVEDQFNGCRFRGRDIPTATIELGGTDLIWWFRLRVIDVCRGGVTIATSATITVHLGSRSPSDQKRCGGYK